jgi:hypothetical protein
MTGSERETSTEKELSGPDRLALKLGSGAHAGVYRATGGKLFGRMGESPVLLPLLVLHPVEGEGAS